MGGNKIGSHGGKIVFDEMKWDVVKKKRTFICVLYKKTLFMPFCGAVHVSDRELHIECCGFSIFLSAFLCFCMWMINVLVSRGYSPPSAVSVLPLSISPFILLSSNSLFHIRCWAVICVSYALIPRPSFEYERLQTVHMRYDKTLILNFFLWVEGKWVYYRK